MITNLVIGSEGFVGKPLCDYLVAQGEKVVRFDLKRNAAEDAAIRVSFIILSFVSARVFATVRAFTAVARLATSQHIYRNI